MVDEISLAGGGSVATFGEEVVTILEATGLKPKRTSVRAPWQNGIAERWIGSARRDCFDRVIARGSIGVAQGHQLICDDAGLVSCTILPARSISRSICWAVFVESQDVPFWMVSMVPPATGRVSSVALLGFE